MGFLGAGLIFKQEDKESASMVVHGLTTAASVWLSAAVGIACGGELYFAASFGVSIMMLLLRFGPRSNDQSDVGDDDDDDENDSWGGLPGAGNPYSSIGVSFQSLNDVSSPTKKDSSITNFHDVEDSESKESATEMTPIMTISERQRRQAKSIRKRASQPSLASMV